MYNISKRRREGFRTKIKVTKRSQRRREGSRTKIKSMGEHGEFLQRITRTLYYGKLPQTPGISLPLTEISCEEWSLAARGRSVRRLRAAGCARVTAGRVSPAALVLALLYLDRLPPAYRANTPPDQLFLVSLMVSNKFLQDDGEDDEVDCLEWAAAGQLAPKKLRQLERRFLNAIDWNIYVSEEHFEKGLAYLERRVALRQGRLQGFFTYSDLASAGGNEGLAAIACAVAAATLAYAASLLALLGGALLLVNSMPPPTPPTATLDPAPPHPLLTLTLQPQLTTTRQYIPNSTLTVLLDDAPSAPPLPESMKCCASWRRYQAPVSAPTCDEWAWRDGWWALAWLAPQALSPLQRWLGRVAEFAEPLPPLPPRWLPRLAPVSSSIFDR